MSEPKTIRSKRLQENTAELLLALHGEFYGAEPANADAFRVLPTVVDYINSLENALHTALCVIENDARKPVTPESTTCTKMRWVKELEDESGIDREKMYDSHERKER